MNVLHQMKQDNVVFDFAKLKLVDTPDSDFNNARTVPQTLEGCEGYLKELPLQPPNVDQKDPESISNMVNVLTNNSVTSLFEKKLSSTQRENLQDGVPPSIYDLSNPFMKTLSKKAKTSAVRVSILGHVVKPGYMSFYIRDGKTFAVPEGRWTLTNIKASWFEQNVSIDQNEIKVGQVLIIRVPPGHVGRIYHQGVASLLDVGTHVFNSGTVKNAGTINLASCDNFRHENYHYVQVVRGRYAKVWAVCGNTLVPRLLKEGEHYIDSHLFKFKAFCSVKDPYISHGSLHVISVEKGEVAKIIQDNKPRLLGEGDHFIDEPIFTYKETVNIMESPVIVHATITILRVSLGHIALAWNDNEPLFIDTPGLYEWDSPDFRFAGFKNAEEEFIQLGSKKIVIVQTGTVGVTYLDGALNILSNGRHIIESATHVFHRFLSTQQKSIRLSTQSAREKAIMKASKEANKKGKSNMATRVNEDLSVYTSDDSDLTICETKDLVKVGLRADVFYSIEDPEKCINKIDYDELEDLVRETAVATLTNIIRSTALNEIAQSQQVSAGGGKDGIEVLPSPETNGPEPSAPATYAFFEKAHDDFLDKLHDDFMTRYGVDIANIRIESFKIMDSELSDQISRHALTTAQIENEMANLEGNSLISTTKEMTAAEVNDINARAQARSLETLANAENQRKIEKARAAADALRIEAQAKAEAEADAILTKARAEAEAIRLKASAEAERAESLSKTKLGEQTSLLSMYSDIVVESNKGVEKVIYMDPSINKESPFAIGSLQNLNYDLHSLSQLGIAAGQVPK